MVVITFADVIVDIDSLAQDCINSSALAMDYCSLAQSHRYGF